MESILSEIPALRNFYKSSSIAKELMYASDSEVLGKAKDTYIFWRKMEDPEGLYISNKEESSPVVKLGKLETIEIWKNSKGENIISQLSCEQWIKVFLKNYDCQKYVFVVDDDSNYFSKYQTEEFGNRSHLGTNYERVIVLTKEQRAYEILR